MTDSIGFPRWTQDVTWSGGSWSTAYPIANLSTLPFARVARTANLAATSTTFRGNFSTQRLAQIIVLCRHNLTLDAQWRVQFYEHAADVQAVFDSGFVDVRPEVYDETQVTWNSGNFWDRKYTANEIAGYPWFSPMYVDGAYSIAAFRIDVLDPTNPDGYVQIGLCEVASALDFPIGLSFGAAPGFVSNDVVTAADGGVEYFEARSQPRTFTGSLAAVLRTDALTTFYELQRQYGVRTPFFWWPDREEPQHALRLAYMARLSQLDGLSQAFFSHDSLTLHLKEVL